MAGIIGTTLNNNQTAYGANTEDWNPTLRDVDAGKETVAGQLHSILAKGNPYIERAKTAASDAANSRGLINSSMAVQAGEAAAIDAAMPIATADANVYGTAARDNQGFSNTAGQFNAGAKNTSNLSLSNAANTSQLSSQGAEQTKDIAQSAADIQTNQLIPAQTAAQSQLQSEASTQKLEQLAQSGQQDIAMQTLKGQQATLLADVEAQYKTLIQSSAAASDIFKNLSAAMGAILSNTDTSAEQKQAAVQTMSDLLKSSLTVVGSIANLDLAGLLDFTPA